MTETTSQPTADPSSSWAGTDQPMATTSITDFQRTSSVDKKTLCGCGGCARRSHALLTSVHAMISSCENRFGGSHDIRR